MSPPSGTDINAETHRNMSCTIIKRMSVDLQWNIARRRLWIQPWPATRFLPVRLILPLFSFLLLSIYSGDICSKNSLALAFIDHTGFTEGHTALIGLSCSRSSPKIEILRTCKGQIWVGRSTSNILSTTRTDVKEHEKILSKSGPHGVQVPVSVVSLSSPNPRRPQTNLAKWPCSLGAFFFSSWHCDLSFTTFQIELRATKRNAIKSLSFYRNRPNHGLMNRLRAMDPGSCPIYLQTTLLSFLQNIKPFVAHVDFEPFWTTRVVASFGFGPFSFKLIIYWSLTKAIQNSKKNFPIHMISRQSATFHIFVKKWFIL